MILKTIEQRQTNITIRTQLNMPLLSSSAGKVSEFFCNYALAANLTFYEML